MSETPIQEDDFGPDAANLGPADAPPGVPAGSAGPSDAEEADPDADDSEARTSPGDGGSVTG